MLTKLFKIHKGEGAKVFQFALLGALLQAGIAIGVSTADSLFLVNVGADKLPIVYIITPFMMLVYIPIYTYLMSRWGIDRVFDLTMALLVGGGVFCFYLLITPTPLIYYLVKLYASLWYIALYTLYWNFTDSYFDIQDGKRLFSIFTGGAAAGAMVGGSAVSLLTARIPVEFLFWVWAVLSTLTWPVLLLVRRRWKKLEVVDDEPARGFVQEIRESGSFLQRSAFVRIAIAASYLLMILATLNDFQYAAVFSEGRTEEQLAALFGRLFAFANGFNLLVNFFLFNRMVLAVGVGNMALTAPITYLIAFSFYLLNYGDGAALFGFFAYNGIVTAIDFNNWNFLFNAVSSQARKQVRTFIEGLCEPVATATVGVFLFVGAKTLSPERISVMGLLAASGSLVLTIFMRTHYLTSMVANLKREWLDFSRPEEAVLSRLGADEVRRLTERARDGDPATARSAIQILWLNDRGAAVDALLTFLSRSAEEDRDASEALLEMALRDEDSEVIRRLLDWLDREDYVLSVGLLEEMGKHGLIQPQEVAHLLVSHDPARRAAAVVASWNSWNTEDRRRALEVVSGLLAGDRDHILSAIRALGHSRQERHAHFLVPYLDDPAPDIRRETLIAVRRLATRDSSRLLPPLLGAIEHGEGDERILGMDALAEIADAECVMPLLAMSAGFTPFERRKAEKVLLAIGLKSVPTTVAFLRDPRYPYKARSTAARALSRLAFPQLEAVSLLLLETELRRAYEALSFHQALSRSGVSSPGVAVLSRFYHDQQSVIVDFVLELLTLGGRLPDFELISASLRSDNRKERGNAIEAIEQGVSRPVFKLLLPLVDGRSVEERLAFRQAQIGAATPTTEGIIAAALESASPLESTAGAQAVWDAGAADAAELLRTRMRTVEAPLFRETVLALLARRVEETPPTLVEKIHCLIRTPFFRAFTTLDLEVVARAAAPLRFARGEVLYQAGDPADALFVLTEGTIRRGDGSVCPPGESFGEESVLGQDKRETGAVALAEGEALRLPAQALRNAARTYPRIAIALLGEKLGLRAAPADAAPAAGAAAKREEVMAGNGR